MRAAVEIDLRRNGDGTTAVSGVLAAPPLWCRWDGSTLWLVGSAASPVGDDAVRLTLRVGAGVNATVRSVAAMVVYAAEGNGTSFETEIEVDAGATLRWSPEPVILTARARHRAITSVAARGDASVCVDETVVLGRADESCGAAASTLSVSIDDTPTLLTSFDTAAPGWHGVGGVAGSSAMSTRLVLGAESRPAPPECGDQGRSTVLRPAGGGALAIALANDPWSAQRQIAQLLQPCAAGALG